MSNHNPKNQFDSVRASEAGKKSRKKGIEQRVQDFLNECEDSGDKTREELILEALMKYAKKGNTKAAEILMDRGFGRPKQSIDNKVTLQENQMLEQMKAMTDEFKEK